MKKKLIFLTVLIIISLTAIMVLVDFSTEDSQIIYKVGIGEEPSTNNFWAANGVEISKFNQLVLEGYYKSLFNLTYPSYQLTPALAADNPSDFTKEGDYYVSVVPLREGLYWSDNNQFTAADVVFTFSTIKELSLEGNWENYYPDILVDVLKVDDFNVKFKFAEIPGLAQYNYTVLNCYILPENQWGKVVKEARETDDPALFLYSYIPEKLVTIDGFTLARWEKGSYWQNKRVGESVRTVTRIYENGRHEIEGKDWTWAGFGETSNSLVHTIKEGPFVDSVVYRFYSNQEAMIMALKRGDIDYMLSAQGLTEGFKRELEQSNDITVVANPSNGFSLLAFNRDRYPFQIYEFHQALATLIDREFIINSVLQGVGDPLATFVPPGNEFWHNPDIKIWGEGLSRAQRIAQAVELLSNAGFTWERKPKVDLEKDTYTAGSGIIMPNGEKMSAFTVLTPAGGYDPLRATWGLWIQMWAEEVGIPLNSRPTQFNVIIERMMSQNYDGFILGRGLGGIFPHYLNSFYTTDGGNNVMGFSDQEYDKIMAQFMSSNDLEEAQRLAYKAQEMLQESLPYIVLYSNVVYDAYRDDNIKFPTTKVLDGVQGFRGLPRSVEVLN